MIAILIKTTDEVEIIDIVAGGIDEELRAMQGFVGGYTFEIFITRFWKASSLYGSLASIFLAAMWLKTITTILFYGEALNVALQEQRDAAQEN